jgi:hypothetical protein
MADNPAQTTPSLPALVWVIPALVVVGNLGYMRWLGEDSHGNPLGEVAIYLFLVAPGSVLFLAAYAAIIALLRRSPRQRGAPVMVALASLAGLLACALGFGLLAVVFMVEAALG